MAFYRTYRPQTIAQLDSEYIREILYSFFSTKKTPQSVLLTGPKGLGKTSAARIIAKVVNCTGRRKDAKTIDPCNKCSECVSISSGSYLDVLEIDGASNRGIDEIRDLREKVKLSPASAQKKVYIIDEVHMLTTEAFNALLKTLEEPPTHVMFILCTTELQKVPATILSRCFHISFEVATEDELLRSLDRIAKGEGIKIEKEALKKVASLALGSFRDGAKVLEELGFFAKKKQITLSMVEAQYRVSHMQMFVNDLLAAFAQKDVQKGFLVIQKTVKQGVDMRYFIEEITKTLHSVLLEFVEKKQTPIESGFSFTLAEIQTLAVFLDIAYQKTKYSPIQELPLELVLVQWVRQDVPAVQSSDPQLAQIPPKDFLGKLIEKVKLSNHSIAGVLRGSAIDSFEKNKLVLTTPYAFHKDRLEDKQVQSILAKACEDICGTRVNISVIHRPKGGEAI